MIPALVIADIVIMILAAAIVYYKKDIVELTVLGFVGFLCAYVLAGGILFWMDNFSISSALTLTLVFSVLVLCSVAAALRRMPSMSFSFAGCIIPVAVCLAVFPFICHKYELFGMGQDQGVYQIKALALIYGDNGNHFSFDEYAELTYLNDIESYDYEAAKSLLGFYGYDPKVPVLSKSDYPHKMTGVLHGVPTYASLLALYGTLFGYKNMADIQTVLLFAGLFMMYYVMRNLRVSRRLSLAGLVIYAASPIVIWTAKATLTEIFIMVLIMLYVYFLVDREHPGYVWASFIPLVVFSFFHITIYTIMPMLVLVYWTLYYMTRDKQYLGANMGLLAGYLAGFYMMSSCAGVYTYGNYKKIFVLGINAYNLKMVVTGVVAATAIITLILLVIPMRRQEGFREHVTQKIRLHMRIVVRVLLIVSIAALILTFAHTKMAYNYSTFYAYVISSGFILIPFLFVAFLYRPQFITAHRDHLLLTIMFVYMVIMYSCIFKPSISFYYYYARYIVPYIPVIVILAMLRFDRADIHYGYRRKATPVVLAVLSCVIMMPNNIALAGQKDITNMSWSIVEDLSSAFKEKDAVIIDGDLAATLKFPVKIMTGADTYAIAEDMREQIARLEQDHDNVYYITTQDWFMFKNYSIDNVYSRQNVKWQDAQENNDDYSHSSIIPFPAAFKKTLQSVNVYHCQSDFD